MCHIYKAGKAVWGRKMIERSTKLYVLIIVVYCIAGIMKILLDVTFICAVVWIYQCMQIYWRIVT